MKGIIELCRYMGMVITELNAIRAELNRLNKTLINQNSQPAARTKVQDRSFSVEEAFKVKEHLFPEMDIFYLFSKDDAQKGA